MEVRGKEHNYVQCSAINYKQVYSQSRFIFSGQNDLLRIKHEPNYMLTFWFSKVDTD